MHPRADGFRCLIVDDNEEFCEVASGALTNGGLTIVGVASTIAETLAMAEELKPDVVLVDIHLGSESGFELAHRLHKNPHTAGISVVLTSVHPEYEFAEVIDASPVAGFIPKASLSADAVSRLVARDTTTVESTPCEKGNHR